MSIAGTEKRLAHDGACYGAMYEIDGPHVLTGPEWAKARGGPPAKSSAAFPLANALAGGRSLRGELLSSAGMPSRSPIGRPTATGKCTRWRPPNRGGLRRPFGAPLGVYADERNAKGDIVCGKALPPRLSIAGPRIGRARALQACLRPLPQ
jgi:hypothetical protein